MGGTAFRWVLGRQGSRRRIRVRSPEIMPQFARGGSGRRRRYAWRRAASAERSRTRPGHVHGVVPEALEESGDEPHLDGDRDRVEGGAQLGAETHVEVVEMIVDQPQFLGRRRVPGLVGQGGGPEHLHAVLTHLLDQAARLGRQPGRHPLGGAQGDVLDQVAAALQLRHDATDGEQQPEGRGRRRRGRHHPQVDQAEEVLLHRIDALIGGHEGTRRGAVVAQEGLGRAGQVVRHDGEQLQDALVDVGDGRCSTWVFAEGNRLRHSVSVRAAACA